MWPSRSIYKKTLFPSSMLPIPTLSFKIITSCHHQVSASNHPGFPLFLSFPMLALPAVCMLVLNPLTAVDPGMGQCGVLGKHRGNAKDLMGILTKLHTQHVLPREQLLPPMNTAINFSLCWHIFIYEKLQLLKITIQGCFTVNS